MKYAKKKYIHLFGLAIILSISFLGLVTSCRVSQNTGAIETTREESDEGFAPSDEAPSDEIPIQTEDETEIIIENSKELGRDDFGYKEIIDMYSRYRYEFNYVISYLEILGDINSCVVLTNNLEHVSFSLSGSMENLTCYTDLGYEKDEEFERCIKTILVEGELGYIYYFRRDVSVFGLNMPIMYSEEDLFSNGFFSVPEIEGYVGRIEGNWYYSVQHFN